MSLSSYFKPVAVAVGLVTVAMSASTAHAQFTTYTTLAAFNAAVGGSQTVFDFNSTPTQLLGTPGSPVFSINVGGLNIAGNSQGDYTAIAAGTNPGNIDGSNFYYFSQRDPTTNVYSGNGGVGPSFTFTLGGPVTAFGFDWVDTDPTDSYDFTVNGSTFTNPPFNLSGPGSGFFGITANSGTLTTIVFSQNAAGGVVDPFGIDNVRVNSSAVVAAVPEPGEWATMAMAALSVGGLVVRARRRAK